MSDEVKLIFETARNNAAHDLQLSNEILSAVDNLLKSEAEEGHDKQSIESTAQKLINIALKLTDQSSKTSTLIAKMVGTIR